MWFEELALCGLTAEDELVLSLYVGLLLRQMFASAAKNTAEPTIFPSARGKTRCFGHQT